ncbi:hypothetical protein BGX38DRAFT_313661 [Terfezia claveryi]|nr:hypothetical protein BGX38DRAFT_313661 [Terfezia claveryi]
MVRLLSVLFPFAGLLTLPCVINSLAVEGTSFVKRATDAEICGEANYYICSDGNTCCPDGFVGAQSNIHTSPSIWILIFDGPPPPQILAMSRRGLRQDA